MNRTTLALMLVIPLLFSALAVGMLLIGSVGAQNLESITIKSDGTVEGTSKIQRDGNTYTLTGNISGTIQVKKSNMVIDGAGFTLNADNGTGIAISSEATEHPSELDIRNVTVKNLRITNFKWGIKCDDGGGHTFYGDYISNDIVNQNETGDFSWDNLGIVLWACSGNNITHCTIGGSPAIYMHFACSNNIVTENNIVFGVHLAISGAETFDGNYWGDYLTRYPNASEVDSSGVWNTPYAFVDSQSESHKFQDAHPLTNSLSIPNFSSVLPTVEPLQEPLDHAIFLVAVLVIVGVAVAIGFLAYFKKHKTAATVRN